MTNFSVCSFVVIFDKKKRVLLSHRRDLDIWNLPGGNVEKGELPNEAAVRETFEETGLKINIIKLFGVYGKPHRDEYAFLFLGEIIGGEIKKSSEADETRFFKLKNIPANTIPKHKERILDAAKNKSSTVIRYQHGLSAREKIKALNKKNKKKKKKKKD